MTTKDRRDKEADRLRKAYQYACPEAHAVLNDQSLLTDYEVREAFLGHLSSICGNCRRGAFKATAELGYTGNTARGSSPQDTPQEEPPIVTFEDGSKVYFGSFAGGAHPSGAWSEVSLRFEYPDGTNFIRDYVLKRAHPPIKLHECLGTPLAIRSSWGLPNKNSQK